MALFHIKNFTNITIKDSIFETNGGNNLFVLTIKQNAHATFYNCTFSKVNGFSADLDINKMNHRPRMNWIKKLCPLKSPRLARERVLGKHQERRFKRRKQRKIVVAVMSYPMYHFEEWSKNEK